MPKGLHKLGIFASAALIAGVPAGYFLSEYTTAGMRHDYRYGYDAPNPQLIAQAQSRDMIRSDLAASGTDLQRPADYQSQDDPRVYEAVYFPAEAAPVAAASLAPGER